MYFGIHYIFLAHRDESDHEDANGAAANESSDALSDSDDNEAENSQNNREEESEEDSDEEDRPAPKKRARGIRVCFLT